MRVDLLLTYLSGPDFASSGYFQRARDAALAACLCEMLRLYPTDPRDEQASRKDMRVYPTISQPDHPFGTLTCRGTERFGHGVVH